MNLAFSRAVIQGCTDVRLIHPSQGWREVVITGIPSGRHGVGVRFKDIQARHCLGGFRFTNPFNPHNASQGRNDCPHCRREDGLREAKGLT